MAKKIEIKTQQSKASVTKFLSSLTDADLKKDSKKLISIFEKATGKKPVMWGPAIIGFGEYTYTRSNGDFAPIMAVGFSPRKSGPVLYVMVSGKDYGPMLEKIGPHKLSKACLYLKSLEGIDLKVLEKLIKQSYKDTISGKK